MKRFLHLRIIFSLFLLALASFATLAQEEDPCRNMPEIWNTLQEVLSLPEPYQVPCVAITLEDMKASMMEDMDSDEGYSLERQEKTARLLGFELGEENLKETTLNMLEDQVAGFYDPEKDTFFIVKGREDADALGGEMDLDSEELEVLTRVFADMVLVHEGHHAIQDHWIDLDGLLEADIHDWDRIQAVRSIVEGDATVVMFIGLMHSMGLPEEALQEALGEAKDAIGQQNPMMGMPKGPRLMSYSLVEAYSMGFDYLAPIYLEEGIPGLRKRLMNPPVSMAAILGLPAPTEIPSQIMPGTETIDRGHLGPYYLRLWLLDQGAGESQAKPLVDMLRGDRFAVVKKGSSESLTWALAFEHGFAARKAARLLRPYLPEKMALEISDKYLILTR